MMVSPEWIGNAAQYNGRDLEIIIYNGRELLARAAEAYHAQVLPLFGPEDPPPTVAQVKAALADGLAVICEKILRAITENKRFPEPDALADIFKDLLVTKYECDRDRDAARAARMADDVA